MLKRILKSGDGQGLVEYALILMLVAMVVIVTMALIGPAVGNVFSSVVTGLEGGEPGGPPDCYGSILLPAMVAVTGLGLGVSNWLKKRPATNVG
jgi:pilus assembly protein Flp/PilA